MVKYVDPTEARIARDNEERRRKREAKPDRAEAIAKAAFREAAGKGNHGPMKATNAVHKASAKNPRKVL